MIDFKNVTKVYDNGTKALNDVTLHIDKGEFVFIVGASGAGKSTFLKLLMREEVPSSGEIMVSGIDVVNLKTKKIPYLRRKMGIVFQDFRLIPNMKVKDNVAFAMRVVGAKKEKIKERVDFSLNVVGLSAKKNCFPSELSGGEQQRVALARALANNPDIIIADEPTGNVDPLMSREIVQLLNRLNEVGTTVIMVTHAHDLVKEFNKRVVLIENGSVVSDGDFCFNSVNEVNNEVFNSNTSKTSIENRFISDETSSDSIPGGEQPNADADIDALISECNDYQIYIQNDDSE